MVQFLQKLVRSNIFYVFVIALGACGPVSSQTWTPVTTLAPHFTGGVMLLLTDGSVISKSVYGGFGSTPGTTWDKLTPDSTGSYVNGTWSTIALMNNDRLYFSSWVMPDGRVYVGGGEYGAGNAAEIYNPLANTWTSLSTPSGVNFGDGVSENLPDGNLLLGATDFTHGVYIYDPVANTYTTATNTMLPHDEVSWLKLPDNSILQVDLALTSTERYIPSSNTWVADATIPVQLYDSFDLESGAALMLPNGQGFFVGGSGHTAYYTPSGDTTPGAWTAGPDLPGGYETPDAPMAMLSNGKILMTVSPRTTHSNDYPAPSFFYEFDYTTNTFTALSGPNGGDSINLPTYESNMLDLPDGSVLYQPQGSKRYYIYTSGGSPLSAGKPAVSNIIRNNCDTFTVTGTLFTGISEGAAYGDDWAMSTNYPIIKINNGTRSWYARSFNWNRPGTVMTGSAADTVQFALPSGLTPGDYTLQVIVNGNPSSADSFNTSISITPSTATVCAGSSTTVSSSFGSGAWTSSNTAIASVGSSGSVTGVSTGSAIITFATGGCISTASVTVTALSAITATAGPGGSISPSGVTNVCPGLNETYTFTPASGYYVSSVTVDGSSLGAVNSYTFAPVTAGSHIISATFGITTYTISASSDSNGSISPSGNTVASYGASQTYSITPATGYHVSDVDVDGGSVGAVSSYTFSSIGASHTISVSFAINTYTISETSNGFGINAPSGITTVNYGDTLTYTMTPDTGYYINDIQVDSVSVGVSGASYTFSPVAGNHSIYVDYEINTYELNAAAISGSSISPSGYMIVNYGDTVTYTITADPGYYISDVIMDGTDLGPVTSYTLYSISDFHSILVYALPDTFVIAASSDSNGTISPVGNTTLGYGDNQTYTISPNAGFYISSVTVDGVSAGATGSYTFSSVSANHTISAAFAIDTFTITASAGANGTVSPSGTTIVSYGGSQTYTITPATGYSISSVTVDGSVVGTSGTYTFSSVSANHTISASFAINTYSLTASTGANGTVSPSGTTTVSYGGSQTYTITPATGYSISSVTVDGSVVGTSGTYTFSSVSASHTISASFTINTYSLTATTGANGTVSPSGTTTVSYGGSQTYTITPATGYSISSVTVDGSVVGTSGTYTFSSVSANHTISASFAINTYSLTATTGANGTVSPSGTTTVSYGGSQTYTITPATGYSISSVTVDGSVVGTSGTYTFSSVSANHTISALFAINTYSLTATSGANGTVSPSGTTTVSYGGSQTYTITPATGYSISSVTVDGSVVGTSGTYTFSSVSANHTISASFAINTYSLTATSGANGTVSPSGTTTVGYGGSQTYTITPSTGYHIVAVTVDGSGAGTGSTYTFSSVAANHSISASFAINTSYSITATSGSNGTVSPSGTTTVSSGGSQTYTITPSTGYHIVAVTVDGSGAGTGSTYTFSSVSANHTISASFAINTYTITSSAGSNGTISPLGTTTLNYGTTQIYTIVPASGYQVNSILIDGVPMVYTYTPGSSYNCTFSSVSANHTISVSFILDYNITASSGPHGSVTPSGTTSVSPGSNHTYSINPSSGYTVSHVEVDGVSVGAVTSYTFSSVAANHTISATFVLPGHKDDSSTISKLNTPGVTLSYTISVYPNPGAGVFNVVIPGAFAQAAIIVTDINGRNIITKDIEFNNGTPVQFDLSNQTSGAYLIRVSSGTENFTTKLIKE